MTILSRDNDVLIMQYLGKTSIVGPSSYYCTDKLEISSVEQAISNL